MTDLSYMPPSLNGGKVIWLVNVECETHFGQSPSEFSPCFKIGKSSPNPNKYVKFFLSFLLSPFIFASLRLLLHTVMFGDITL